MPPWDTRAVRNVHWLTPINPKLLSYLFFKTDALIPVCLSAEDEKEYLQQSLNWNTNKQQQANLACYSVLRMFLISLECLELNLKASHADRSCSWSYNRSRTIYSLHAWQPFEKWLYLLCMFMPRACSWLLCESTVCVSLAINIAFPSYTFTAKTAPHNRLTTLQNYLFHKLKLPAPVCLQYKQTNDRRSSKLRYAHGHNFVKITRESHITRVAKQTGW